MFSLCPDWWSPWTFNRFENENCLFSFFFFLHFFLFFLFFFFAAKYHISLLTHKRMLKLFTWINCVALRIWDSVFPSALNATIHHWDEGTEFYSPRKNLPAKHLCKNMLGVGTDGPEVKGMYCSCSHLSLVPGTHIRQLTIVYNTSLRGVTVIQGLQWHCSHMYIPI